MSREPHCICDGADGADGADGPQGCASEVTTAPSTTCEFGGTLVTVTTFDATDCTNVVTTEAFDVCDSANMACQLQPFSNCAGVDFSADPRFDRLQRDDGRIDLSNLNLRYTDFTDAILTNADLTNSDLTGADFSGADLSRAGTLVVDASMTFSATTTCPDLSLATEMGTGADIYYTCEDQTTVPVEFTLFLADFVTQAPLENLVLEGFGQQVATDVDGRATLLVPPFSEVTATLTGPGIRDHYIYNRVKGTNFGLSFLIATEATIAALAPALGVTVDATTSFLNVQAVSPSYGIIPDMTIDPGVASAIQLVQNPQSPTGLSPGNATTGASSFVIFVDIESGDITPTFDHQWGHVCDLGPLPLTIPEGAYVIATYECDYPRVEMTVTFNEFLSGQVLPGLSLEGFGQTSITDANGQASLMVPAQADMNLLLTGPGIRPHHLYFEFNAAQGLNWSYGITNEQSLATLGGLLGSTVDNAAGILSLGVSDRATNTTIPDMTITSDQTSEAQLVFNSASQIGLSPGDTTLAGSNSRSIFVNHEAGPATISLTHADNWDCRDVPNPINVPAGAFVIASYRCEL